jgi:hypothetical protein
MGLKIHEYANEAFQINDEDFYDVDFWTGSTFESRKISGATLKSILSANIYNSDGTLDGNRLVLVNQNILKFLADDNSGITPFFELHGDSTGVLLEYRNTNNNRENGIQVAESVVLFYFDGVDTARIELNEDGINFNSQYTFPQLDGSANQVLTTDGNGNLSFQDAGAIGTNADEFINNVLVSTASLATFVPHFGIVPDAGTYLVLVNFEARNNLANQNVIGAIFKNNVNEMQRTDRMTSASQLQPMSLQKILSFDGVDSLNLRIAMSGGSTTTEGKSIVLIKIA